MHRVLRTGLLSTLFMGLLTDTGCSLIVSGETASDSPASDGGDVSQDAGFRVDASFEPGWDLTSSDPNAVGVIPMQDLGCPTGATIILKATEGSGRVRVSDLEYHVGTIPGDFGRQPQFPYEVHGAVWGEALDSSNSDDWIVPGDSGLESRASLMLVEQTTHIVESNRCFWQSYEAELEGEGQLSFSLELLDGDSASISYSIESFDCADPIIDADQTRVCDQAWQGMYDRIAGSQYSSLTCPRDGFSSLSCDDWDSAFVDGLFYGEEEVQAAVRDACDESVFLSYECC